MTIPGQAEAKVREEAAAGTSSGNAAAATRAGISPGDAAAAIADTARSATAGSSPGDAAAAATGTAGAGTSPGNETAGFTLEIVFDGLCVYVPGPSAQPNAMTVLLINACDGNDSSMAGMGATGMAGMGANGAAGSGAAGATGASGTSGTNGAANGGASLPAHLPFVAVDYSNIEAAATADGNSGLRSKDWWSLLADIPPDGDDDDNQDTFPSGVAAVHFFSWEDLSFDAGPATSGLTIAGGRAPGSQEPGKNSSSADFTWVPQLELAAKGSGELDPRCFDLDPPRYLVIGRLRLTTGSIGVTQLAQTATERLIWQFQCSSSGAPTGYSQAMASEILYSVKIDAPTVTLRLTNFNGDPSAKLTLAPAPDRPPVVTIKVGNLPLTTLLALEDLTELPQDAAAHFQMLYKLSLQKPSDPPVPVPITHPVYKGSGGVSGGTIICPGALASPNDRA
jgi:hypothetical protein